MGAKFLLSIDQGTTSSRAILFDTQGKLVGYHQIELQQYYPHSGWVEHDAEEIWQSVLMCIRAVLEKTKVKAQSLLGMGICNQRETTLLWDKRTDKVLAPAIVWQDRRTADQCEQLKKTGLGKQIQAKTGLLLDPYFSASKLAWLLENIPHTRKEALAGNILFGTIDSFLLWRLTDGKTHATDITNAARTMLFNLHTGSWDKELLEIFAIPAALLPEVKDNCCFFGTTSKTHVGLEIPILAMAGDQQAATIGLCCLEPGMVKSTYGTGGFLLLNTGQDCVLSQNQLISTVLYRIHNQLCYALEGSFFVAGSAIQWLRDTLHLFQDVREVEILCRQLMDNGGVYLVPAFTGLGAPYWDPHARGAIFGLTRDTSKAHLVRAAVEASAYQTRDLLEAMKKDSGKKPAMLRVDGGMSANNWFIQFLADLLDLPIERPPGIESSARGVAFLVGLTAGIFQDLTAIANLWQCEAAFQPSVDEPNRYALYQGWLNAIARTLLSETPS